MATTTTRKTYSHPHLVERRVAQWHEPTKKPSERRKRLLSLHCGLVNALFAVADFSTPAREVTSLLLDVSQGQTTITIPDTELIKILKAKESGLTDAAARKRLQRGFAALIRDQLRAESTFIACCRGDKIKVWDGERMGKLREYCTDEAVRALPTRQFSAAAVIFTSMSGSRSTTPS